MSARARVVLALGFTLSCADQATIGALCPPGCEPRPEQSSCNCAPGQIPRDASAAPDAAAEGGNTEGGAPACLPRPLARSRADLLVVFDDSASLAPWYLQVYEGFRAFLREESSRGLGVGLLRFGDSCFPSDYSPPLVPIAPLPENIAALEAALPAGALSTNSTLPALEAAEQYAQRWAADHPEARVSVLLLTDASPGGCDGLNGNYDVEAPRLAAAAKLSSPAIDTYVVAPGSFELVDAIARAGGTALQRLPITATSDDALAALRGVRDAVRDCQLALPSAAALTPASQVFLDDRPFAIGSESTACDRAGFYLVDDRLIACPQTCDLLDSAQSIELADSCEQTP